MPVQITDLATGQPLGTISEEQLQALADALEEESAVDQDYYINTDTIDAMEAQGSDPALVSFLRTALAGRQEMDIRWDRS